MNDDFIGLADSLIEVLAQKDKAFLRHYNWQLKKEIINIIPVGREKAIKYVGKNSIPVIKDFSFLFRESLKEYVVNFRTLLCRGEFLAIKGREKGIKWITSVIGKNFQHTR